MAGKLVDGVAYEDELDDKVPELRDGDEAVDQLEVEDYRGRADTPPAASA